MNKDVEFLAEAYQQVQENIVTDKIKHIFCILIINYFSY